MFSGIQAVCLEQEPLNFVVLCLREIFVPNPDREERVGRVGTYYFINILQQFFTCLFGRYGDRCDKAVGSRNGKRLGGSSHAGASGKSVIDDNYGTAMDWRCRSSLPIEFFATL